jgi:DNA-binding beta-propeller fold protein YncE
MNHRLVLFAFAGTALLGTGAAHHPLQQTPCAARGPTPLRTVVTAAERNAVPFATSGVAFISVASSGKVILLDLRTGERTMLDAGIDDPHEVAVSPDGRWGVAADFGNYLGDYNFSGRRLAVFDLKQKRLARVIELGAHRGPHDLIFLDANRLVVTTQTTREVVEVDVASGRILGATETRAQGSHTLAVSAGGRLGFTANQAEGTLSRLDLANRRFLGKHIIGRGETEGIAATPDGKEVWMGFNELGAVLVVNGTTGAVLDTIRGFQMPERMVMTGDGRYAVITDFRCETVQVADVRTRKLLGPIEGLEGAGIAKVLPDHRTALVLLLDERVLVMADLPTRRVIARHQLGGPRPDAADWGRPSRP